MTARPVVVDVSKIAARRAEHEAIPRSSKWWLECDGEELLEAMRGMGVDELEGLIALMNAEHVAWKEASITGHETAMRRARSHVTFILSRRALVVQELKVRKVRERHALDTERKQLVSDARGALERGDTLAALDLVLNWIEGFGRKAGT